MQAWKIIKDFWFLKKGTKIIWKVTEASKKISSQYNYKVTYKYNIKRKKNKNKSIYLFIQKCVFKVVQFFNFIIKMQFFKNKI